MIDGLRKLFGVDEEPRNAPATGFSTRTPAPAPADHLFTTSVIGRTLVATVVERDLAGPSVFDLAHSIADLYQRQPALRNIVIDMENVRYLDSSGLSALVDMMGVVKPRVGQIAIAAATQQVEVLFKLTRLELVFMIKRTSIEAINSLEKA